MYSNIYSKVIRAFGKAISDTYIDHVRLELVYLSLFKSQGGNPSYVPNLFAATSFVKANEDDAKISYVILNRNPNLPDVGQE